MECNVCLEKCNKNILVCPKCQYTSCEACYKNYLDNNNAVVLHCFDCKYHYSDIEIRKICSKKFIEFYKSIKKEILFDIERALFPSTQELAKLYTRLNISNKRLTNIKSLHKVTFNEFCSSLKFLDLVDKWRCTKAKIKNAIIEKYIIHNDIIRYVVRLLIGVRTINVNKTVERIKLEELKNFECFKKTPEIIILLEEIDTIKRLINNSISLSRDSSRDSSKLRVEWVKKCPYIDCKGFLDSHYKCGLCDNTTCKECWIVKDSINTVHVCNKTDIATKKLIFQGAKSCITCGALIHKIDGCAHMFCPFCNTTFNWTTGKVDVNSTNPHYYEYMRNMGLKIKNEPNTLPQQFCRDNQDFIRLTNKIAESREMSSIHQLVSHIIQIEIPSLNNSTIESQNKNLDARIKYLCNETTIDQFKKILHARFKKNQLDNELLAIFTMLKNTMTDIYIRFNHNNNTMELSQNLTEVTEAVNLLEYTNTCCIEIAQAYNSKHQIFDVIMCTIENIKREKNNNTSYKM